DEVSTITGIGLVLGSLLISRSTCRPSIFGSFKSSKIKRGPVSARRAEKTPRQKMKSNASSPSRACWIRLARLCFRKACKVSSASEGLSSTNRISTPSGLLKARLLYRVRRSMLEPRFQREIERCCLSGRGFCPHFSAVSLNDPLNRGQSYPRTFKVLLAMQPLEDAE